jgi:hypothetical protein
MSTELRLAALDMAQKAAIHFGGNTKATLERAEAYYEWLSGKASSQFGSEFTPPSQISDLGDGA